MKSSEPEPLWRAVVGDTEPWRRGRLFLVIFALLTLLNQALLLGVFILAGFVEALLISGIAALLFWLQFYFIWIGVHWVRWLTALFYGTCGFVLTIWGVGSSNGIVFVSGLYTFTVSAYLGLAPSVYFFAQRQRQINRTQEALGMAVVFLLMLGSLGAGVAALIGYKRQLEGRAYAFANEAFERVFAKHDTYFLLDHTSDETMRKIGRERMTGFLQDATIRAGDVQQIKPAYGELRFRYTFPFTLATEGYMITDGIGPRGRIELHMYINDFDGDWKMDQLAWIYPDSRQSTSRRPPR